MEEGEGGSIEEGGRAYRGRLALPIIGTLWFRDGTQIKYLVMITVMKFSFLVQKSCPYNCRGLQFYGHSIKCKKAVHTPAEVCSCMDTLFATPKTVHTPAEVCSLRSEFEGGPKTVHTPAEVCSLRSDSESCPYNCRGRQFELHIHCPHFSLLRKLSIHLQRSAVLF